jgi:PAS domain S-box-containing protein
LLRQHADNGTGLTPGAASSMSRSFAVRTPHLALAFLAAAVLLLAWPGDAAAMMRGIGFQPDDRQRTWLTAISGFSLGLALGLMVYELRARGIAIKLRRLKDLASSVDGRDGDETPRGKINHELERLSDEVLYSARRISKERREFDQQATAWQAMFAATLDSMFVLDGKGHVKDLNPAAERQFKINAADAVGKHLADLLFPLPHRALDNAAFMQDIAAGKAVGRRQELIVHCGQRQFPVEMAVAEFHVGEELGLIVTARDISAHRQTRADLKRVREQADRLQARLRGELAARRPGRDAPATLPGPEALVETPTGGTPFTLEDACGDVIRKLVVKAERKGLGFRYEDTEVQGMGLIGDASRLRGVASELIDSVIRHSTSGEVIVHFSATSKDERSIELVVSVTSTGMTVDESTHVGRPVVVLPKVSGRSKPRAIPNPDKRAVDVAGVETEVIRTADSGVVFKARMHYAVDLSRVTIDLGALAGVTTAAADDDTDPRMVAEFARAAARLRHNADKGNLGALWAQAHRLKEIWLPLAPLAEAGLVSALAHTARGGDGANARMLARRLAEALDATVRQNMTVTEADIEEPVA